VLVPPPDEYVANGAARQAAWVLTGGRTGPPDWPLTGLVTVEPAAGGDAVRERYAQARGHVLDRLPASSSR
jgi:xylulokinase